MKNKSSESIRGFCTPAMSHLLRIKKDERSKPCGGKTALIKKKVVNVRQYLKN